MATGPDTLLIIDVQYEPGGPVYHWWLAGPPPFGTHPDPHSAWQALVSVDDPFDQSDEVHLRVFSGPEEASVRGFWRGKWVQAKFQRNESVSTERWERVRQLLQPDGIVPA